MFLQRHGTGRYVLPHRIDHVANMRALVEAGCERVLAIGSVGGLRSRARARGRSCAQMTSWRFGTAARPRSTTSARTACPDSTPTGGGGSSIAWRERVGSGIVDGGVYWQTRGPRLETPAEIRLIAAHAQVVGMTIASECVAASDLGLAYAAICVVDNLANGVGEGELTDRGALGGRARNREAIAQALRATGAGAGMSLAVVGARLDGRTVGLRADGRQDRRARAGGRAANPATS